MKNALLGIVTLAITQMSAQWIPQSSTTTNNIPAVQFLDANNGIALAGLTQLNTSNGGQTWTLSYSSSSTFNSLDFPSPTIGYAVGTGGAIVKYDPSSGVSESSLTPIIEYYPNPVSAFVHFNSPMKILSISLFSPEGRKVMEEKPGTDHISLDLSALSSGIYLWSAVSENGIQFGKLVRE